MARCLPGITAGRAVVPVVAGVSRAHLVAVFPGNDVDNPEMLVLAHHARALGILMVHPTAKWLPYALTASYSAFVSDTHARHAGSPHSQRMASRAAPAASPEFESAITSFASRIPTLLRSL